MAGLVEERRGSPDKAPDVSQRATIPEKRTKKTTRGGCRKTSWTVRKRALTRVSLFDWKTIFGSPAP